MAQASMTPRLDLMIARALGVLNVALAIAVLAGAPRLVQIGLASLTCGLTLPAAVARLADRFVTGRTRSRPHLAQPRSRARD